jgi:hypothetical protein
VIEGPNLRVTELPGDLLKWNVLIFEVTERQALAQPVENLAEAGALLSKTPPERPLAHAELLGDLGDLCIAAGKQATEPVFHQTPQSAHAAPRREQLAGMRLQDLHELAILGDHPQLHDALGQYPAVCGLRELDRASQDALDLPQIRPAGMRKGYARRGDIAVREPAQHPIER